MGSSVAYLLFVSLSLSAPSRQSFRAAPPGEIDD